MQNSSPLIYIFDSESRDTCPCSDQNEEIGANAWNLWLILRLIRQSNSFYIISLLSEILFYAENIRYNSSGTQKKLEIQLRTTSVETVLKTKNNGIYVELNDK